ncbi:hypothetical protein KDA08_01005 [Candidatus Saccharibacteria bacterium]|nr:hypothetical protein [Candidatus Saccharibacteria bacterium]
MRNDSYLYTGITSASNEPKTPRELQKESKEEAKRKLKPAADIVLELLMKEREGLYDIRNVYFDTKTSDDELRVERIVRIRHEALIIALESKIKTIMADKPEKRGQEPVNG